MTLFEGTLFELQVTPWNVGVGLLIGAYWTYPHLSLLVSMIRADRRRERERR